MGRRRSLARRTQQEAGDLLKHKFLPVRATGSVECPVCEEDVPLVLPALPKPGARITLRARCACGTVVAVTVVGRPGATPGGSASIQIFQEVFPPKAP